MLPFTAFLWRLLPELRFVQFPWRWLEVLALAFAFFVAAAIGGRLAGARVSWALGAALFVALGAGATAMVRTAWWDSADVPSMVASVGSGASGSGYRGTDEYDPVGCDRYELPGDPDDDERVEGVSATPAPRSKGSHSRHRRCGARRRFLRGDREVVGGAARVLHARRVTGHDCRPLAELSRMGCARGWRSGSAGLPARQRADAGAACARALTAWRFSFVGRSGPHRGQRNSASIISRDRRCWRFAVGKEKAVAMSF